MVVSVGLFQNFTLGNGWKSPFPSTLNWLFGVAVIDVYIYIYIYPKDSIYDLD